MDFIEVNRDLFYDENFKRNPRFKTALIGDYGLQYILKHRHNIKGIAETKDIDIMVSTTAADKPIVYKLFLKIAKDYAQKNKLTLTKNNIIIRTNNKQIDILITNKPIEKYMIDQDISDKVGIPIFAEEYFMLELLRQNLCKFRPYCEFLAMVTIEKLSKMSREKREEYFKLFRSIPRF